MPFRNLLLIDDDEDDRGFFLQVLESLYPNVHCVTAENGRDALTKLSGYRPDVIFLDLNMPLMSGRQFLQEIQNRAHLNQIPVIILSTSSDKSTIEDTKRLGARDFITKPDKLSGWESRLKEVFNNPTLIP